MDDIEQTPKGISQFIVERVNAHWKQHLQPLLISKVAPELQLRGINYRSILEPGTTLKQFVSTVPDVKIVVHPLHKAKIGIVPKESSFTYEIEPTVTPASKGTTPKRPRKLSQRFIVQQFLTALSKLPEEDLKSISIPVHILAKLMEEK